MGMLDFTFEFKNELDHLSAETVAELRDIAESRLTGLADEHTDLIGAAVTLSRAASGETPHLYRAHVVAYIRPNNIAGEAKGDDLQATLHHAIDIVERQVWDQREKLREPWKHVRPSP